MKRLCSEGNRAQDKLTQWVDKNTTLTSNIQCPAHLLPQLGLSSKIELKGECHHLNRVMICQYSQSMNAPFISSVTKVKYIQTKTI